MRHESTLASELERLKRHGNPRQRGYEFQSFVASLFRREHFRVQPGPRSAAPRQVDLLVTRGDETYLIETKWRKDPANVADIDALFTRLEAVSPSVTGIMLSYSGFSRAVVERVRARSNRPVVLVTGSELERVVEWDGDLLRLLRRKRDALLWHRDVALDVPVDGRRRARPAKRGALPSAAAELVFPDGRRSTWVSCGGGFGPYVFAHELPDVDWVVGAGFGVTVDVALPTGDEGDLIGLVHRLSDMGWTTANASWSIQQSTANWHGLGARAFAETLAAWDQRYAGLEEVHHSEELCYVDACDGGFYTLTATVAAHERRVMRRAHLSFQLEGVPLDTRPLQQLCDSCEADVPVSFRPRREQSVTRRRAPAGQAPAVTTVALVVRADEAITDPGEREWVVGAVVENPNYQRATVTSAERLHWLPDVLSDSQYLVADLRSWHPLRDAADTYRLWELESAWTSHALVIRPLVDWG